MLPVRSLHTVLICEKWEECVSFYRDVLGFSVVHERERFVEFQVTPDARIGILEPLQPDAPRPSHDRVILSICVEDIEEAHAILAERWPALPAIRKHPWGPRVFELRDPEGWRIEFWTPDDSGPGEY
jgi:catechol 2,3-dioxygenase-like lactoylglutathione lyase family enzyme